MNKTFWPLTIGFLVGAGGVGFLVFKYLGVPVSTTYSLLTTLFGGLSGVFVGGLFEDKALQ